MDKQSMEPVADRPYIPEYGVPESEEGMLPWSYVQDQMKAAINYWVCTTSLESGRPHATPVWGIWMENMLYFDGSPQTRRGRDMARNPEIAVHLEDGLQPVMLEGQAFELKRSGLELRQQLSEAYCAKYGTLDYSPDADTWENGGLYVFYPRVVYAWTKFPTDATRWRFTGQHSLAETDAG